MTDNWTITGGEVLMNASLAPADLHLADGRIAQQQPAGNRRDYDARGAWVLPGIVDLHGDAFESILEPRSGVRFPYPVAFAEADKQLLANGITTAFHALTVSWEPGLRSIEMSRGLVDALGTITASLHCDTHLNIRWETFAIDHVDEVLGWLGQRPGDILSINDHTSANRELDESSPKLKRMAGRMGVSVPDAKQLIDGIWARRDEVPGAIARICAGAGGRDKPILSHDQSTVDEWATGRDLGVTVSEFPMTVAAARAARDAGEHVVLGAPNALRGQSHTGSLSATSAIRDGLCSVLASDYYYPAPMRAAFRLHETGVLPLAKAWALVSTNPARAANLTDRGDIAPGQRGDIVIVDKQTRDLRAVFANGKKVLDRG